MTPDFWHQRWQRGEIGWHNAEINPCLEQHWPRLGAPPGCPVFVPLCGKSRDLLWLAGEGYRVIGNELSPIAIDAFLAEHGLAATRTQTLPFTQVVADEIELLVGDFFDLQPQHLAGVGAGYDRGSLIALPPALRPRYAERLASLLPAGTPMLLITLDYDQSRMDGPPFSVSHTEVMGLFGPAFAVESIAAVDVLAGHPRFVTRGVTALTERVYRLQRR